MPFSLRRAISQFKLCRNDSRYKLRKIIITGANGVGKSHLASRMHAIRPDIPLISFDAIKLLTDWQQKPRSEIDEALARNIEKKEWILEGGPSLLAQAIRHAEALIWVDPPEYVRTWQLATRPWKFIGKTRPELPPGNIDWPWQQYKFALHSLKNRMKFRTYIQDVFDNADGLHKWRCRGESDCAAVIREWTERLT